ncbi:MAG: hypothetical protein Q7S65_04805, partial [Nanoarchaeota archaeon]|nr:hypothetical protein [Nanoarchaeota archaeon]
PGDSFTIEVELENLFQSRANQESEINDIEVTVTILDIDDEENLEFDTQTGDLNFEGNERKEVFRFNSTIPLQTDNDFYTIEIEVSGEDDFGHSVGYTWTEEMQVSKDAHDVRITELKASPTSITCEKQALVTFKLMNLGRSDEPYLTYTLSAPTLGIEIKQPRFTLDSDIDRDENVYTKSQALTFSQAPKGDHKVTLTVYRDGDILEDISAINIESKGCGTAIAPEEQPVEETVAPAEEEELISEEEEELPAEAEVAEPAAQQPHQAQPVVGTFIQKTDMRTVLVSAILVVAIAFGALLLIRVLR